jgi:hypothetical protein
LFFSSSEYSTYISNGGNTFKEDVFYNAKCPCIVQSDFEECSCPHDERAPCCTHSARDQHGSFDEDVREIERALISQTQASLAQSWAVNIEKLPRTTVIHTVLRDTRHAEGAARGADDGAEP